MRIRIIGGLVVSAIIGVVAVACTSPPQTQSPASATASSRPAPVTTASASAGPAPVSTPSIAQTPSNQDLNSLAICGTIQDHLYEACFAYVWNDAHGSLQPYYKYVHSKSLLSGLANRLELKYQDQALRQIQQRTANWPTGTNDVDGPDIAIIAANSSLTCNRAVLVTRENWTVRDARGNLLYQENGQLHTVVLLRTPDQRFSYGGYTLHQWVVSAIYDGQQTMPVC